MGPCSCLLSSFVIWAPLICLNRLIGKSEKEEGENHSSCDRLFLLRAAKKGFSWQYHDVKLGNLFHSHLWNVIGAVKYFISLMVVKNRLHCISINPELSVPVNSFLQRSLTLSSRFSSWCFTFSYSLSACWLFLLHKYGQKKTTRVSQRERIKIWLPLKDNL